MNKKRLGILGSGYLSGIVVDAWKQGLLEDYEIVGVMGRTPETVSEMAKKAGCVACLTLDELLAQKPDYIADGKGFGRKDSLFWKQYDCAFHWGFC